MEASRQDEGDMAAMREALSDIIEKIDKWRTDGSMEHWQYSQLFDIADAALAAPPRNCDVQYNDRVEMDDAFKDWCNARGHTMNPKLACDAFDWLLAHATKKEGDAK